MKISALLKLFVLLLVVLSPVKNNAADNDDNSLVKRSMIIFPENLQSDVPGIVESTIYNIVLLKNKYPEADLSILKTMLNKIAEKNSDLSIRYKAHLASIYLSFSEIINIQPVSYAANHDYLFKQINEQLRNKLLVTN